MKKPLLPPSYVNIPAARVYDTTIPAAVFQTYVQLRGMAWGQDGVEEIPIKQIMEVTGKSRSTIYGHLAVLRDLGWLLFSSTRHCGLTCRFQDLPAAGQDHLSKSLDCLNEEVKESFNPVDLPAFNDLEGENQAASVQISGLASRSLDRSNGYHDVIDAELGGILEGLGVYRTVFPALAEAIRSQGWDRGRLVQMARDLRAQKGAQDAGKLFVWRVRNGIKPRTEEDARAEQAQAFRELFLASKEEG